MTKLLFIALIALAGATAQGQEPKAKVIAPQNAEFLFMHVGLAGERESPVCNPSRTTVPCVEVKLPPAPTCTPERLIEGLRAAWEFVPEKPPKYGTMYPGGFQAFKFDPMEPNISIPFNLGLATPEELRAEADRRVKAMAEMKARQEQEKRNIETFWAVYRECVKEDASR